MHRIQPQSIIFDSADHYRVRFEGKNGVSEYTFSVIWTGEVGVLNCDQREFYFDTYDDPATKLLLKAIDAFDEARRSKTLKPVSIMVDELRPGEPDNKYLVQFQTDTGEMVCGVTIENTNVGDIGFSLLVSDSDLLEITEADPAADRLRESIFALHEARHFKYAEESKPTPGMRPSQSDRDASRRASA